MASAHLSRCLHALQALPDALPDARTRNNARDPPTHSPIPRQQGSRHADLVLLAQATGGSTRPLRHLFSAHARSRAIPPRPASSPPTRHFHAPPKPGIQCGNPGDDGYAKKKCIGCVGRTAEARETGTFPILRFSPSPYLLYLSAALRRSRSGGAVFFGLIMFFMH